jgi:hypothetical protein
MAESFLEIPSRPINPRRKSYQENSPILLRQNVDIKMIQDSYGMGEVARVNEMSVAYFGTIPPPLSSAVQGIEIKPQTQAYRDNSLNEKPMS